MSRLLLLVPLVWLAGCAPALAPPHRAALDRAAAELDERLAPAATLAATAAAIHARDGAFPDAPFALLGDPLALDTGARAINLSALELRPEGEALVMTFTLLPTRDDPTDRLGTLRIRRGEAEGRYAADVSLRRTEDPDHGVRTLPIAAADPFEVRRLDGRFALDLAGAGPERPYVVRFTPVGDTEGLPPQLTEGYVVQVGDHG